MMVCEATALKHWVAHGLLVLVSRVKEVKQNKRGLAFLLGVGKWIGLAIYLVLR